MNLRALEFYLRETLTNISRNATMSLAAVSTVAVSFIILGASLLIIVNLDALAASAARQVHIIVELDKGASKEQTAAVQAAIKGVSLVREVRYVSGDQALRELKGQYGQHINFSDIEERQKRRRLMPDFLEVFVTEPQAVPVCAKRILQIEGVHEAGYGEQNAEKLLRLSRIIKIVNGVALALLGLGIGTIIHNTVRLTIFARRREIRIMQLVGATNTFIRIPFILEGVVHGLVGAALAWAVLRFGYSSLLTHAQRALPFMRLVDVSEFGLSFFLILLGAGAAFGLLGTTFSVRKFTTSL